MEYFKKCLIKSGEASFLVKDLSLVSETQEYQASQQYCPNKFAVKLSIKVLVRLSGIKLLNV